MSSLLSTHGLYLGLFCVQSWSVRFAGRANHPLWQRGRKAGEEEPLSALLPSQRTPAGSQPFLAKPYISLAAPHGDGELSWAVLGDEKGDSHPRDCHLEVHGIVQQVLQIFLFLQAR